MESPDELIKLSDPGEVGRAEHNKTDRVIVALSNVVAWFFPILMIVICTQVVLRTLGRSEIGPGNQAWMDDLQWWMYGFACLVGIAYAITTNSHVRVDIFYDRFSKAKQSRIDKFALGWLLIPFLILCWDVTFHYAVTSVEANEGSSSPNGLHGLYLLKIAMHLCFLLMIIAAIAALVRNLAHSGEATLARFITWAFPSVWFIWNLTLYYLAYWYVALTAPPDLNPRRYTREPIFGEIEIGNYELKYMVIAAFVATILTYGYAVLRARRAERYW